MIWRRRRVTPKLVNATHLIDWLHNELAGTDDAAAEKAYQSVIDRVAWMCRDDK